MSRRPPASRPPVALIGTDQEWVTRALESALEVHGYAVVRAPSGSAVLEAVQSALPDLILLNASLPDLPGVEVCRLLREGHLVTRSTPIVMLTTVPITAEERITGLRAGAWDFVSFPLDAGELLWKLTAYVGAKFDADRALEEGLLDSVSGLYNMRGLERRARELTADAFRRRAPLACVTLRAETKPTDPSHPGRAVTAPAAIAHVGHVLQSQGRVSDAIGRSEGAEFTFVAPGTDAEGAVGLVTRLAQAIESAPPRPGVAVPPFAVRAGYAAVSDYHAEPIEPAKLLAQTAAALRLARVTNRRVQVYQAGADT